MSSLQDLWKNVNDAPEMNGRSLFLVAPFEIDATFLVVHWTRLGYI